MPKRATFYIILTIAIGSLFIVDSLSLDRDFTNVDDYVICFALALLTATFKVRLPGLTGTISASFLFILIAIAIFTFSETVLLAGMASIVQSLWKTKRRPKVVQVAFNAAALAISSGLTYRLARVPITDDRSLIVLLGLAACIYFTANTFLISGVLSLIDNRAVLDVWRQCHLWSFPYYAAGALIASLVVTSTRTVGWKVSLLILPMMYLVYVFYRNCVERLAHNSPSPSA
jgi:hypothetical protein